MPKELNIIESQEKIIYIFEEIENNLHPSLQRRLFNFVHEWIFRKNNTVFFTTHSHIPINLFAMDKNSQIIHLQKEESSIVPKKLNTHKDSLELLEDLDVKASDILQSNGVIWVEGPTDRIYIKKWIELFNENGIELIEGYHYQIVFYGGRLLSHIAFEPLSNEEEKLINLLLTNRNSAIVIDSDIKKPEEKINETKERIKEEFERNDQFCWITEGKEIENYIPKNTINNYIEGTIEENFGKYDQLYDLLEKVENGKGEWFRKHKVKFSREIAESMDKETMEPSLDLKAQMNQLIEQILKWNSLSFR